VIGFNFIIYVNGCDFDSCLCFYFYNYGVNLIIVVDNLLLLLLSFIIILLFVFVTILVLVLFSEFFFGVFDWDYWIDICYYNLFDIIVDYLFNLFYYYFYGEKSNKLNTYAADNLIDFYLFYYFYLFYFLFNFYDLCYF
jgi:hypothetical protein